MPKTADDTPLAVHDWHPPLWGQVTLAATERGLCFLSLSSPEEARGWLARRYPNRPLRDDPAPFADAIRELTEYLERHRTEFTIPLDPAGTPFQHSVWAAMARVPHGCTSTYGALAEELGRPTASRAVGAAVGANPLCIILPCHRIVGTSGRLTGYAYGLAVKERLLALEGGKSSPGG